MQFKPHKYQDYAINTIIENEEAGLFLDMGLGKTVSTLTAIDDLMYNYFTITKVLVIAPLRVAEDTWSTEISKWDHISHLTIAKILGSAAVRQKALHEEADIYIINRENVQWLLEQFGDYKDKRKKTGFYFKEPWPFDMVVIDELSSFKSQKSIRFKMLKKARPYIDRIVGLTGTPAPNGLLDLWPQLYLLDGGERLGKAEGHYKQRYFRPSDFIRNRSGMLIPSKYELVEGGEEAIYDKIGDICISMKSEDWLDLPERIDNFIEVNLGDHYMAQYKELEKESILELGSDVIDAGSAAAISNKLQQFAQGEIYTEDKSTIHIHDKKLEALDELIEEANGKPVLVFYWFKHDEARLLERYNKKKAKIRKLNTSKDIQDWNDGKIDILLAHPASAGHGLNLQRGGSTIIWFGMTWSLELYQQANARLHRQGQTKAVIIHHLMAKGTVDERIAAVLSGKEEVQNALMYAVRAIIDQHK